MWPEPEIIDYRRYLKRRNMSPQTVRGYLYKLKQFFTTIPKPVLEITPADVAQFMEALYARGLKAKTINCYTSALRQLYQFWREEHDPECSNPVRATDAVKQEDRLPQTVAPAVLDAFLSHVHLPRDQAIFRLMLRSGLRVQEVAGLQVQDCDFLQRTLRVRHAKNRRERIVYLSDDALANLQTYLQLRGSVTPEQSLFVGRKGKYKMQGLSVRAIQKRIEHYRQKADVAIHAHQFRHTFASSLLAVGVDLTVIQELLGHRQVQTTQNYCRVTNLTVRANYFKAMQAIVP